MSDRNDEPEIARCPISDGLFLVAILRGRDPRTSRVIFAIERSFNDGRAIETTEITETEAQTLLAMRAL